MFSRDVYEIVHVLGIAFVMCAFGGIAIHASTGGAWKGAGSMRALKVAHHLGMLCLLVGGFGMLARIGIVQGGIRGFPGWLWAKIAIFLVIGGTVALPYRRPQLALPAFFLTPTLAALAVY